MNLSLTPQLEESISEKVPSGPYSEVVREALRPMFRREKALLEIKRETIQAYRKEGIDQIERGEGLGLGDASAASAFCAATKRAACKGLFSPRAAV